MNHISFHTAFGWYLIASFFLSIGFFLWAIFPLIKKRRKTYTVNQGFGKAQPKEPDLKLDIAAIKIALEIPAQLWRHDWSIGFSAIYRQEIFMLTRDQHSDQIFLRIGGYYFTDIDDQIKTLYWQLHNNLIIPEQQKIKAAFTQARIDLIEKLLSEDSEKDIK